MSQTSKSEIQNSKSGLQNSKFPNPKSEIQNPKFAHKDLLHNAPKSKMRNPKSQIQNQKIQNPKSYAKIQNLGHWVPHIKNCYITIQNPNSQNSAEKVWIVDFGLGNFGFWIPDLGFSGGSRGCTTRQFSEGASRSEARILPGPPQQPACTFLFDAWWTTLILASLRWTNSRMVTWVLGRFLLQRLP